MNILHIYKSYYPDTLGGCEQVIQTLAKYTYPLGCNNSLLTASKTVRHKTKEAIHGLTTFRYPTTIELASCPISLTMLKDLSQIVSAFDVIHYHFPWPFADLLHLTNHIKKPSVVTYHSDIVKQKYLKILYRPIMKAFLNKVDRIAVTSPNYLASSQDLTPYHDKCTVIPIGIEDKSQVDENQVKNWRARVGENFLLYIGVLRYYKGVEVLLAAMKDLPISLVIVGTGPMEQALKRKVEAMRLHNVQFVGRISEEDKHCLLKLSRAVVLPSIFRSEAFGISLLEGMMFGKPVISTELHSGTTYINEADKTGLVVEPNNANQLRTAINTLFTNDILTKRLGQAARQRYLTYFTPEKMAESYLKIYQKPL
jgi:rhamnosyl/mannosyltransferase